jgi:hypothetical protein
MLVMGYGNNKWRDSLLKCICISLLSALPAFGFLAKAGERSSRWVTKPVVIDGNNDEWPQPYPFREEVDTRIQYAIANDAQTLYLTLKTSDESTKMKLRRNGLVIIADTTGKKSVATNFGFEVKDVPHDTDSKGHQRLQITETDVKGSPGYDSNYMCINNKTGITVAAIINDFNELVWEIAIPFKCIYPTTGSHVAEQNKISICFVFFGLSTNDFYELGRAAANEVSNAAPIYSSDTSAQKSAEGGKPVRNANGGMGIGIGGGKGVDKDAPVVDAVAAMQDRQRASQDNRVWKDIKLSYEQ